MLLHTISVLELLLHYKQTVSCTQAWGLYLRVIVTEFDCTASGALYNLNPYLLRGYTTVEERQFYIVLIYNSIST